MEYNFNLEHPFYFTDNSYSEDSSPKYNVGLPYDWHEVKDNDEWVFQYPIGKFIERQGWKIHISSEYNTSHDLLEIVSNICHTMKIPFKHLSSEDKFILRNSKLMNRGFSGKFITCYPNQSDLEPMLNRLEDELVEFNGPYILSDKRWKKAPIYLRYGVFRPTKDGEKEVAVDELIIGDRIIKDERLPRFKVPEGLTIPDFLVEWLNTKDEEENQGEFPFIVESAIRFSNSGGLYNARLKNNEKDLILKEARPYTGLGFDGTYSSDRLTAEYNALGILKEFSEVPQVYWFGKIWEHTFLCIECMEGIPLNRWVTKNYPLYAVNDNDKQYLLKISNIIERLISLIKAFHRKKVYHQDLHLGNVLIKDDEEISIIDWEQALFSNSDKTAHKVAASGFRAWGDTYPNEVDWYGIRQIAHYLFLPLITSSDLVYNFVSQTRIEAKKQFEILGYHKEHIANVERLLLYLDSKCPLIINLSRKKIFKPLQKAISVKSDNDIYFVINKMLKGFSLSYNQWQREFKFRYFPVHYYGLEFNQGLSFSDLGILWSYYQLAKTIPEFKFDDFDELKMKIIDKAIRNFDSEPFTGLFDGVVGTIWLIYELGDTEIAAELFNRYFKVILEQNTTYNLYSGRAGILLVAIYLLSKNIVQEPLKQEVLMSLERFASSYLENPEYFCKTGFGDVQSNDPYENYAGLLYGHTGIGWLFGEAYRYTGEAIYKNALELAIDSELLGYRYDNNGSLQYSQGHRLLPYLATGSSGLFVLIKRNIGYLSQKYSDYLPDLEKAINPVFCVLPGLFNGFCGLEVVKYVYNDTKNIFEGKKNIVEGLYKYLIVLEEGLVIAGDNGLKLTTDVASGFAGVAIALTSIMENKLTLLPQI